MSNPPRPTTFIATLGGQPQVVTFALDALLARGTPVSQVMVVYHPYHPQKIQQSLTILTREFECHPAYQPIHLQKHRLEHPQDIHSQADANAAWEAIQQLIVELKNQHHTLHIGISGGRRILGLMTLSAAMLHFGHEDRLYHMYTPDEVQSQARDGRLLHVPPDSGFALIPVPMMPWGSYFPVLRQLANPAQDIEDVLSGPRSALDQAETTRCATVVNRLTTRQRDVLSAFAQNQTPQEVAQVLGISIRTVDSHKTVILAECRNAWELPEDTWLNYHFLFDKFNRYLSQ